MESELLLREQEFHKINSELEERTSRILQEIDAAKSKIGHESPHLGNSSIVSRSKSLSFKNEAASSQKLAVKDERSTKRDMMDDPLAIRSNGLGYEATNRLLRAKLTFLNKEVDSLRQDNKSKSEECRKITAELARSEEEINHVESSLAVARDTAATLQSKLESTSHNLTRVQAENSSLHKELTTVKKDLKHQRQQNSAVELRLNRALEDCEKLRSTSKQMQLQIKEDKDSQRKTLDQLQLKIKNLERQRTELTSICTKQSHLIDNLRRQKTHLEVTRYVQSAETEFDNILDWCLKGEKETKTKS